MAYCIITVTITITPAIAAMTPMAVCVSEYTTQEPIQASKAPGDPLSCAKAGSQNTKQQINARRGNIAHAVAQGIQTPGDL